MHAPLRARFLTALGLGVGLVSCAGGGSDGGGVPTTGPIDPNAPPPKERLKITTNPPGARIETSEGAVLCAATPCEIANSSDSRALVAKLEGYKPLQLHTGPSYGDQTLTLIGEGEPEGLGCGAELVCVPPWDGTTPMKPPFQHCTPKLPKKPGDTWHDSGFTPSGTLERRKKEPEVCCYMVGHKCAEKGRPLRDGERVIVAGSRERADWLASIGDVLAGMPGELRAAAAARWRAAALAEHASVASFARFSLELQAIGAPSELVAAAQAAALDEIEHARIAFALASSCDAASGPGPLACLGPIGTEPAAIAAATFRDGCVAETIGALQLREAARRAESPALARMLEGIAEDEERHAELAWRAVAWMRRAFGADVERAIGSELERLGGLDVGTAAEELAGWGLLTDHQLARCAAEAVREVIVPCAEAFRASLRTTLESGRLPSSA